MNLSGSIRSSSDRRRGKRYPVWLVSGVLLGALFICACGIALLFRGPVPPTVHIDYAAGQRLKSQLDQITLGSPTRVTNTVRADETEVNSLLDSYLHPASRTGGMSVTPTLSDVKLTLNEDRMRVYALVTFGGQKLAMDIEGKVSSADGFVSFKPLHGQIGRFRIPQDILDNAMKKILESPQSHETFRLPSGLQDLRVEESKLVIVAK